MNISPHKILILSIFACSVAAGQVAATQHITSLLPVDPTTTTGSYQSLSTCVSHSDRPVLSVRRFYFESCIRAEFAASLVTKQGQYIYFLRGQVDRQASYCENISEGKNPKLMIEFECGWISFLVNRESNNFTTYIEKIEGAYEMGFSVARFASLKPWTPEKLCWCDEDDFASIPVGDNQTLILKGFSILAASETNIKPYAFTQLCLINTEQALIGLMIGIILVIMCMSLVLVLVFF